MRELVIAKLMRHFKNYDNIKKEKIKYGLETIYILVTKTIIILLLAYKLHVLKETIIFTLIYNIIRIPSFGIHATKSIYCLISSIIIFVLLPFILTLFDINFIHRFLLGLLGIFVIYKNAPADTYKRPIKDTKIRKFYKAISSIITVVMVILSLIISNSFIHNCLIGALLIQCIIVSKTTYKLFNLPYDNYKGGDRYV